MAIIPNENYVAYFKQSDPRHREWLQAVLDHLTALEPKALSEGYLRDLWLQGGVTPPCVDDELAMALPLIREFEGLHLEAYPDPLSGGDPWTIGWGATQMPSGRPVRPGDRVSRQEADMLLSSLARSIRDIQAERIPTWGEMSAPQRAALISFAYNLGPRWYNSNGFATLSRAVRERLWLEVPQVLELYRNPGSNVEAGLLRRRRAEGKLFSSGTTAPPAAPVEPKRENPLAVRPFFQLDSATDQARRMCFSSSNAMLVEFLKPGTLKGPNGDDQYLRTVKRFGDTTSAAAQLRALDVYGIRARFEQQATNALVEAQLRRGIPVPCGYVHRGPISRPTGGGHWLTIIGDTTTEWIAHDPLGEPDLQTGATKGGGTSGAHIRLSKELFARRWMVEPIGGGAYRHAPGKGWAIIA